MLKRILLTFMTALVFYSLIVVVYKINEPDITETASLNGETVLDYESLKDYTLNSGASAIHYYFFYSSEDNDSIFVENTVLKQALSDSDESIAALIEYIDIADLVENLEVNRLKTDWGVSYYPAFVACHVENGEIIVDNSLEWNSASPFTKTDLIGWFEENGLFEETTTAS